jgi:Protein of unknown function (DUF3179)
MNVCRARSALLAVGISTLAACGGSDTVAVDGVGKDTGPNCLVNEALFYSGGVGKDGIPALTDPKFVPVGSPEAAYLRPDDRIIGLRRDTLIIAIPHNILWWHEIVNLSLPGIDLAVTYCPLTGSAMAFDRSVIDGAEFGVSGILFMNNLVMYDRRTLESLWPQMMGQAACGPKKSVSLKQVAVREMTWARWSELYPDTRVLSGETGWNRNYQQYPYGSYEELYEKPFVPIGGDPDPRRPPKERVLGIPDGKGGGIAYPFLALDAKGAVWAENATVDNKQYAVFWDREGQTATAFDAIPFAPISSPIDPTTALSFRTEDGKIFDLETGSEWTPEGRAVAGSLAGSSLEPVDNALIAFWFAWASFNTDTELWEG